LKLRGSQLYLKICTSQIQRLEGFGISGPPCYHVIFLTWMVVVCTWSFSVPYGVYASRLQLGVVDRE